MVVAVRKGHPMTARGGAAERFRAALPASGQKTDTKEQLRGENVDK